ncbi:arginase family protein, partial [Caldithrix abyssi]|nr:arginase family protein [Caldithrix abyssi]
KNSPSGEPADMALSALTGFGPQEITHFGGMYPLVKDEDVVVYGIREPDQIDESPIRVYDRERMLDLGIERSVVEGLENLASEDIPLWLHFDVDVLDPNLMPVLFPEPNGLTFEETQQFLNLVLLSGRVIGMNVTCYHGRLDADGSAGKRLVTVISNVLSSLG